MLSEALRLEIAPIAPALMRIESPKFASFVFLLMFFISSRGRLIIFLNLKGRSSLVAFLERQIENKKQ